MKACERCVFGTGVHATWCSRRQAFEELFRPIAPERPHVLSYAERRKFDIAEGQPVAPLPEDYIASSTNFVPDQKHPGEMNAPEYKRWREKNSPNMQELVG